MYKRNDAQTKIDQWITTFKGFENFGIDRLLSFAKDIEVIGDYDARGLIIDYREKNSNLHKFMNDNKDIIEFFLKNDLAMPTDGKTPWHNKETLESFFGQINKEDNMSLIECRELLEDFKLRGITVLSKRKKGYYGGYGSAIYNADGKLCKIYSDAMVALTKERELSDCAWFYNVSFDPNYRWNLFVTNPLDGNMQEMFGRTLEITTFKIKAEELPTKEEMDSNEFNPEDQKGYSIVKNKN